MNILPLIFALILMLSVLTIEKLDNFKNKMIVQKRYETTLKEQERAVFNAREKNLYKATDNFTHQQTTFRGFLFKDEREKNETNYKQFRLVATNLIKIVYGSANFFKKAQQSRPELVEDLLDAIQNAADQMPKGSISRIQDIARIKLADPILQEVYYHMLKGTVEKETYKTLPASIQKQKGKTYFPLLTFFNFNGLDKPIFLRLAPTELLMAIYGNREVVNKIIALRVELSKELRSKKSTLTKDEATEKFQAAFEGQQHKELSDILDYTITKKSQAKRN